MAEAQQRPRKIPLGFYREGQGREPVREWLKGLPQGECHAIGKDLLRAQVQTDLPTRRTVGVLICLYQEQLGVLHGFIKKTRTTSEDDLALARKRKTHLSGSPVVTLKTVSQWEDQRRGRGLNRV